MAVQDRLLTSRPMFHISRKANTSCFSMIGTESCVKGNAKTILISEYAFIDSSTSVYCRFSLLGMFNAVSFIMW
jgi:hypothetical protein